MTDSTTSQRTWLITGVSSGFGREMAEQLLNRGDGVVGTVRKLDAVADLQEQYPNAFQVLLLDVTDTSAIRSTVDRAFAEAGRIDVVVSNAGYGLFGAAEELSDEQIQHIIATNLTGSIQLIRAALPHLRAQGGGRILQTSTYGGQAAFPGSSMYHATKWGIEGFVESVAQEVASFNIGVTIIEPGGAPTSFLSGSAQISDSIADYDGTPAHAFRDMVGGDTEWPGDTHKMVAAMIASANIEPAPLRVLIGSDSYSVVSEALKSRLAAVEEQKQSAGSTDAAR
jgi:NAD(P)-dependent dehydrogenase (short-subunit alcohol dehydrogenase family)